MIFKRAKSRRLAAAGAALALLTTVAGINSQASAAAGTLVNPGTYVFAAQGGFVNLVGKNNPINSPVAATQCSDGVNNDTAVDDATKPPQDTLIDFAGGDPQCTSALDDSEVLPGYQPKLPFTFTAAIAADGTMSNFVLNFPATWVWTGQLSFGNHIALQIAGSLNATGNSGTFNPTTGQGNISLNTNLTFSPLNATLNYSRISDCKSTFQLNLSTTNPTPANPIAVAPVPYDPATGLVTMADNNFPMPQSTTGVSTCTQVYTGLGIPAAAGASAMQFTMKAFPVTNHAPTADAGTAQNVAAGSTVTLNGGGTDTDAVPCDTAPCPTPGPLYYRWHQTSGTPVTLSNPLTKNPTFTAPGTAGVLGFQLEVADGRTTETSSETPVYPSPGPNPGAGTAYSALVSNTTVTTSIANVAPVANAGPAQSVNEGSPVTLDGSASNDPDSGPSPLTYNWTQTAGPPATLSNAHVVSPTFTAPLLECPGSQALTFSLTVSDGAATSPASTVTITDNDVAPGGVTKGDYNGDGKADVATYNQSKGFWLIECTGDVVYGQAGDIATPGDFNGDGKTDIAVYTPKTSPGPGWTGREGGYWIKGQPSWLIGGKPGDLPIAADFTGDGKDHPWLYQPATGTWVQPLGVPIAFGAPGAIPVPADYNGDGTDDLAYYVPSTGDWHIANGLDVSAPTVIHYGGSGFVPVPGTYDATPGADLALVKVSTGNWFHPSSPFYAVATGLAGDIAASGDFAGTGHQQFGRYRPSCTCEVYNPLGTLASKTIFWGRTGYRPVNEPYAITTQFP